MKRTTLVAPMRLSLCGVGLFLSVPVALCQTTPAPPSTPANSPSTTEIKELKTLRNQATGVWTDNSRIRVGPPTNEVLSGKMPMGVWSDKLGVGRPTSSVFSDAAIRKAAESSFLQDMARREMVNKQFQFVTIPKLTFRDATFESAVALLRQQAQKSAGAATNINAVILSPIDQFAPVTLDLTNIPFLEGLRYLCDQAGADFSVEPYAIAITKQGKSPPFRTSPKFPSQQPQLSMLVIPQVELKQASLVESLDALKQQATRLLNGAITVNIVINIPPVSPPPSITLSLRGVPFMEALRYVCDLAHADFNVEKYGIVISSAESPKPTNTSQIQH